MDSDPVPHGGSWSYDVFFSASEVVGVNERDLDAVVTPPVHVMTRDQYLLALLMTKLENPVTDMLYAYQASRTQAEAYQFKPVLKFLDARQPGILIADEVGLGKTIEAAILFLELDARSPMRRVLVVCPAGLRQKWQSELATRFGQDFHLLDRQGIERDLRRYQETGGAQPLKAIVALESIRARPVQELYDAFQVNYDLVIIDEAHHLRTSGRLSNAIGERLSSLADNLVLLTATPLQTDQRDLFNLIRFIDDTQFPTFEDFVSQLGPNALLNTAIRALRGPRPDIDAARVALERIRLLPAAAPIVAHPNFAPTQQRLAHEAEPLDRQAIVTLQRDIDQMNVLSAIYSRTKKSDVSDVAKRRAVSVQVPLTGAEAEFYAAVFEHARDEARTRSRTGLIPGWAGMQRERQAASCIAATAAYYRELAARRRVPLGDEASNSEVAADESAPTSRSANRESPAFQRVLNALGQLGDTDSKLTRFLVALESASREAVGGKVIVFSFFRRTLAYLEKELRRSGYQLAVIHGGIKPADRAVIIDRFRADPHIQVLLASEVGAEGLDFQFCDTIINYDLPWNPMRVEQRIGRIDRYGQTQPIVHIYSLFLADTIEQRILERLYDRIGIFTDSIGDLEPILGPIVAELTRELFSSELTAEEEEQVLEQQLQMVISRRQEQATLETRRAELLGQDALLLQAISDNISSGRYVSAAELRALLGAFVAEPHISSELVDRAGDGTVLVAGDAKLISAIEQYAQRSGDTRAQLADFLGRLRHGGRVAGTFDGTLAHQRPLLELFSLQHPLVQTAVDHYRGKQLWGHVPLVEMAVDLTGLPGDDGPWPDAGEYCFVVYLLAVSGVQRQARLVPIVFDHDDHRAPSAEGRLLRMIQDYAVDRAGTTWTESDRDNLLIRARQAVSAEADRAQAEAQERNGAWLAVRKATVERTFKSKIEKRQQLLERATDDRIVRMRRAEIANLRVDLARAMRTLDDQQDVSATFKPIGMGRMALTSGVTVEAAESPARAVAHGQDEGVLQGYPEPPPRFRP